MALSSRLLLNGARALAAGALVTCKAPLRHPLGAVLAGLWLYPTLRRNCAWHGPVATRFQTGERRVWLTFDDGPDGRCTPLVLDLLEHYGAKASFFVVGRRVDAHRAVCREMVSRGHTVENHTATHPSGLWWMLPSPVVRREIEDCSHAIRVACGRSPLAFRSPVGMNHPGVHPAAEAECLRVVGWSAAGGDACPNAPSLVVAKILRSVSPGAILVLHCGSRVRHRLLTLRMLMEELRTRDYTCVIPAPEELVP